MRRPITSMNKHNVITKDQIMNTYGGSDNKAAARARAVAGGSSRMREVRRKERLAEPSGDRHGPRQRGSHQRRVLPGGEGTWVGGDEGNRSSTS